MKILIADNKLISEIQEEFQKIFPYLKIEFFKNKVKNSTLKSQIISGKMPVGMVRHIHAEGILNVDGSRSVEDIENDLQNKFGLRAEVFRKSGNMWIETSLTHHWSLLRQNFHGRQMS